jgi:hypothetical protein
MLTRLLTILPLLLCPLLMLAFMWTMRNRGTPQRQGGQEVATAVRVARLERELAELRASLPEASPAANDVPAPRPDPSWAARNGTPVQPG